MSFTEHLHSEPDEEAQAAYNLGWNYRHEDRPISSNAYTRGTDLYEEFRGGWHDADTFIEEAEEEPS